MKHAQEDMSSEGECIDWEAVTKIWILGRLLEANNIRERVRKVSWEFLNISKLGLFIIRNDILGQIKHLIN